MRRLIRAPRHRDNRGVSAMVFALMAPVLIAAVGLSVDGGKVAVERANVQSAADSAARAIGQDCARASRLAATAAQKARCTNAGSAITINLLLNGNAPGAVGAVTQPLVASSGSATVTVTKVVPMAFGSAVGINSKNLSASATVTWGQVPTASTTFPLGMNVCDYNDWKNNPSSEHQLYRYDIYQDGRGYSTASRTCATPTGGYTRSIYGALWLIDNSAWFNSSGCTVSTGIGFTGAISATNLLFPSSCADRARDLVAGKTYLLPIFDSPTWNRYGSTLYPTIRGYAPFVITGWSIGGSWNTSLVEHRDYDAPSCFERIYYFWNGCRGIQGYFTGSIVQLEEVDSYGVDPTADFGSIRVKLTS